ncbi:GPI inositol-deacylase [Amia ocellicauda]|uniref:GPI inositol-deacylase n=1 Tax=Amia ocellicauda TaxID=2972642 RepID=UPI0034638BB7
MGLAAAALYGGVLALLGAALREVLLGYEDNRCSMTYMFENPEYLRVQMPRRVSQRYPGYRLFLYGEGLYAEQSRSLKLSGAPVLFLPGNAGSYKQARSLGSVALRKAEDLDGRLHLDVFTVDFGEELVALYGGSLQRQTRFVHESIRAILRLYRDLDAPPRSVAVVGHSMGGIVARALFTLPRFSPPIVSLILTQASPHQGPVLPLDSHLLDFYSSVGQRWSAGGRDLRNVTVLSVGGGYRDYQVRSGLTALPCPPDDPNKLSLVSTAVPRTWMSTDHLSIVWCKELVLATVRAFFDLLDPDTHQMTEDPVRRMAVLRHHFVRHPVRLLSELDNPALSPSASASVSFSGSSGSWMEVRTPRLSYSSPKEPRVQYFIFPLSSRRRNYSHFHCQNSNLEMTPWLFGCTETNGSVCLQGMDLSWATELLPAFKVATVRLGDLPAVSHLVLGVSNLSGRQFSVECEWLSEDARTVAVPIPHVLSFGLSVSAVTLSSAGLLHTVQLQDFHQVYQAFKITVESQCKGTKERLPSVSRLTVPWFREDSFTTMSVPSATQIFVKLHTSRPDNSSSAALQLHTAPDCQYKVSVQTSFLQVLGQVLRFCGPVLPVYMAVSVLLPCEGQLLSLLHSGRPMEMSETLGGAARLYRVELLASLLHLLLRLSWFQAGWSTLGLPPVDALPLLAPDVGAPPVPEPLSPAEGWTRPVLLLLLLLGAAVAFWGGALIRLALRLLALLLGPLHRPCVDPESWHLGFRTQMALSLTLGLVAWATCGALALATVYLLYLYKVTRLMMTERTLKHVLNLAPQQTATPAGGGEVGGPQQGQGGCNGVPLLTVSALEEVQDNLRLQLSLSSLLAPPALLAAPSLIHWLRRLRYSLQLQPDPCWPSALPLVVSAALLMNCNTHTLRRSTLLSLSCRLQLPLCVAMVTFSLQHLYRVTYFLSASLGLYALCCLT